MVIARRAAFSLLIFFALAASGVAFACPTCAAGSAGGGVKTLLMGMMVLPFLVVGVVLRVVLRTGGDLEADARLALPNLEER
jgi:hypothetical protein